MPTSARLQASVSPRSWDVLGSAASVLLHIPGGAAAACRPAVGDALHCCFLLYVLSITVCCSGRGCCCMAEWLPAPASVRWAGVPHRCGLSPADRAHGSGSSWPLIINNKTCTGAVLRRLARPRPPQLQVALMAVSALTVLLSNTLVFEKTKLYTPLCAAPAPHLQVALMAVSALTVLLSNTLEESQFVAAPARRKRLILEGPLAALQGPDDSEDEAAGGWGGALFWAVAAAAAAAAAAAGTTAAAAAGTAAAMMCATQEMPGCLVLLRLPATSRACPLPHVSQTRWRRKWMPSSKPTCRLWMGRRTPSLPAASACCRAWARLRAWCDLGEASWAEDERCTDHSSSDAAQPSSSLFVACAPLGFQPPRPFLLLVPQVRVLQCVSSAVELLGDRLRPHLATICAALPQVGGCCGLGDACQLLHFWTILLLPLELLSCGPPRRRCLPCAAPTAASSLAPICL